MTTSRAIGTERRHCTYCPKDGPEVCIRVINRSEEDPGGDHVYAHRKCAERNGDQVHYVIVREGSPA
ncbi:hypothetical protein ACPCSP_25240 [Streptomyces cinereoruber]|uniref:hypothetical protein n=1 Tax=Streptomyces cinereoruber TaxID=67260 RepID=UPI00363AA0CB